MVLGTISDNDTNHYFTPVLSVFFGQTSYRNSVVMATPKVPGDQKLFEKVNYILKLSDKVSASYTFFELY